MGWLGEDNVAAVKVQQLERRFAGMRLLGKIANICDDLPAFSRYAGISAFLQPLLRRVGELITVLNLRMADATVVTGHLLRSHAQDFSRDVLEIPNGVDGSRFVGMSRWEPGDRPALGYVGILEFFVDLRSAIEALKAMEGSKLIIAGDGRDRTGLEAFARSEGLENRIEFLGKVAYDQLPRWIGSMDICLLPFVSSDLTESALPLKIHEYAACRRPVISTPLFEVVRMYGDLLTYAQGPIEISSKVGAILEDRQGTIRRIRRSHLRATVTYSWDRFGARYQEAFLRARGSRGTGSSSGG
jgi:glycosyltransferase involved in cell wall biosynthesis